MARATRLALFVAGLAVGALSLALARQNPAYSFGAASTLAGTSGACALGGSGTALRCCLT